MSVRLRKLVGTVLLLLLITVWSLTAMAVAQFPVIFQTKLVAGLYYVIAGIGWIFPAMPLIKWMIGPVRPR